MANRLPQRTQRHGREARHFILAPRGHAFLDAAKPRRYSADLDWRWKIEALLSAQQGYEQSKYLSDAAVAIPAIMMVGCQKAAEQPNQVALATSTEAKIPEKDRIDNTAEVEAIASKAKLQAQVDQYNKDEAEMIDKSRRKFIGRQEITNELRRGRQ